MKFGIFKLVFLLGNAGVFCVSANGSRRYIYRWTLSGGEVQARFKELHNDFQNFLSFFNDKMKAPSDKAANNNPNYSDLIKHVKNHQHFLTSNPTDNQSLSYCLVKQDDRKSTVELAVICSLRRLFNEGYETYLEIEFGESGEVTPKLVIKTRQITEEEWNNINIQDVVSGGSSIIKESRLVLVIGYTSGTTIGCLTLHPERYR